MKSVSFSITRVNRLRRAAVRARTHLAERPDPWPVRSPSNGCFAYAYDANDLIRVFDTLRPPPADRRPRCVGRRAEANRRRTRRQLDVAPHRSSHMGADFMPRGERPRRSSCTSVIPSVETGSTRPRTPIRLVATIARPGPRCCARARGVSTTDRCPRKLRAMNAADSEQAHGSSGMRLRSGRRRSGAHGCDSDETPPPHARTRV